MSDAYQDAFDAKTINISPPDVTCPKGHKTPKVSIQVWLTGSVEVAKQDYCAVCFAEWVGKMFPLDAAATPETKG